jgi:hypothetical protein
MPPTVMIHPESRDLGRAIGHPERSKGSRFFVVMKKRKYRYEYEHHVIKDRGVRIAVR